MKNKLLQIRKTFFPFIIGEADFFSIEHRFLNGTLFFSLVIAMLASSLNIILDMHNILNIVIIGGFLIFLFLYFFSRFKKYYAPVLWIFIIFLLVAFPITWFLNSGILGSTSSVCFIALVLFNITTKGKLKIAVSIFFLFEIFVIILVEYARPELVLNYTSRYQQFMDISVTLGFSLVVLAAIIFFIMKTINIERLKAEENNRLKTYFLANISHEIRTPMNGILGFAELLRDKNLSESERDRYLDIIKTNGNHLLNLINDVIKISRIEAGHAAVNERVFNLNLLLLEMYDFFKMQISSECKPIELKCSMFLNNENAFIFADDIRIRQTFLNLLGNASKFTETGSIEFGYTLQDPADAENRNLLLFVKDTGIGIEEANQKMIFDIFKQADDSHTRKYGGTGLGLSITRRLIELMGGKIWVKSAVNQGSAFYFTIPYKSASGIVHNVHVQVPSVEPSASKKGLILIVEDHDDSYRFLERFLRKQGFSIIRAVNGIEAVAFTGENKNIKLILMDIQLPLMSGYEAVVKIREFNKSIPIIAQTGNAFEEDRLKCIEAGCNDFIIKPLDINILMDIINKNMNS